MRPGLEQQGELLDEREFVASADVEQQYDRDLGPMPGGFGLERKEYEAMVRARDQAIRNQRAALGGERDFW